VKRTVVILAGVTALCMVAYLGGRLAAEPPAGTSAKPGAPAAAPQPQSKVAVLNLSYVIKNYQKWTMFQSEYKGKLETYDGELKKMKEQLELKQKDAQKPGTDPGMKEQIDRQMRDIQRAMQDKTEDGKKVLAEMEAKQFSTIYKDVQDMATRYARSRGIEIVMHYNDGTTEAEVNNPMNIGRKMGQGACFPLYMAPGIDISADVLAYLNQAVKGAPTTYTPPASH
jgi:Skp family chaperone for outer membrane proteins